MSDRATIRLQHTFDEDAGLVTAQFRILCERRNLTHTVVRTWSVDAATKIQTAPGLWSHFDLADGEDHRLVEFPNALVSLHWYGSANGSIRAYVAAASREKAEEVLTKVEAEYPKVAAAADDQISVRFWFTTPNGPQSHIRKIDAPDWAEIRGNYGAKVAEGLDGLMSGFTPSHGGQIILWHGPAGTGKTYALRALCSEWRKWATPEYIVDPENAFGRQPDYLMKLLLGSGAHTILDDDEPDDENEPPRPRWRLLIMEDTGDLISDAAREQSGQGLSRLLNVSDGFLGQGLRVLVLITTNEQVGSFHPAIARPGRAARVVEFPALTHDETMAWAANHGLTNGSTPDGERTLAELYAEVESFAVEKKKPKRIGFRPPVVAKG